jgi:antitoxin component YwqK of YwqJK toxin-antitoxin module
MTEESILNFPKEINALISTYLEDKEGDYFRDQTEDFIIKEVRGGNTYGNGVLHSFNDMPAEVWGEKKYWYKNGKIHRDNDLPAVIYQYNEVDETQYSYRNGLSIIIYLSESQYWYKNGELHRDNDLPAVIFLNDNKVETQEWYKNGKLHRDNDMPALINHNGTQEWYQNGQLHRENDMPAVIYKNGTQEWHRNGQLYKL